MNHSNLLDLAAEFGLSPKKTSTSNGGEYHSSCPNCGGKDRFIIWSTIGRYWCRQCEVKGDAIQFCRDFFNMSFLESCDKVGMLPIAKRESFIPRIAFEPKQSEIPSVRWIERASNFISDAHSKALIETDALSLLKERGFSLDSIMKFQLGWNEEDLFEELNYWGVKEEEKKKVWLPKGLVIPTFFQDHPMKIKIRRSAWKEGDSLPKYVEIKGSRKTPSFYGECDKCLVLLESELDAMLLQQFSCDLCTSIAIGGVKRRPDLYAHEQLLKFNRILFSLDFDDAGKKAFKFWKSLYPFLIPWPTPRGKSVGDAFKLGVDLRKWIESGLRKQ